MNRHQRLVKLERACPSAEESGESGEALFKLIEDTHQRMSSDFVVEKAANIELAAHMLFADVVRKDVLQKARQNAKEEGPVGKLFLGILEARGVQL